LAKASSIPWTKAAMSWGPLLVVRDQPVVWPAPARSPLATGATSVPRPRPPPRGRRVGEAGLRTAGGGCRRSSRRRSRRRTAPGPARPGPARPGPGSGSGTSTISRTSGPPKRVIGTARMQKSLGDDPNAVPARGDEPLPPSW
jgi:hypothetical protein